MATITVQVPVKEEIQTLGAYKEFAAGPGTYSQAAEEEGDGVHGKATYPHYLPTWNPDEKYPPLKPFEHIEHGRDADKTFPDLLTSTVRTEDLTPTIGTTISGIQLSSLSDAGKDQLALFAAQRKVLVFLDQDFADLPIQKALDFGAYFGRLHIHPTNGTPKGYPEIHLVHRGANDTTGEDLLREHTTSIAWHSDVTYEEQPPGTTFLYILDNPETGGDTIYVDHVEAYNRLSPAFQQRLHGLQAVHSGIEQVEVSRARGSAVRREPVRNVHPIVRTHPATGQKALYVNSLFTRSIVGYKKEESEALLKFLYDHLALGADFHVRIKWQPRSVVVWDNRLTSHSAVLDSLKGQRRHLARITPQAERPYETPFVGPKEERNGV